MLSQNQRIWLGDALSTLGNFAETYKITDRAEREKEQNELLKRIEDDIRTTVRFDREPLAR